MSRIPLLLLALFLAAPVPAQDARPLPADGDEDTDNEMPATEGDAAVLAQLAGLDEHHVALAEVARRENPSQPVADYASTEDDEHAANLDRSIEVQRAIGLTRAQTPDLTSQAAARAAQRDALAGLDGDEFTRAYIQRTVQDHADALAQIDRRLARSAHNDDVTAHLQTTRAMYARHLEAARSLIDDPDR